METQFNHHLFVRRPIVKSKTPAVKWFKEWVPQDVVTTGGKCLILKWVTEDTLKGLKEKAKEPEMPEPEPEPTTEVLFLCSYEGCGKTFIDAGALRKHSHIHGERQYVCHYDGCGKLADFGLAVLVINDSTSQVSLPAGTIGYIDPCYTLPTKLSTKSDVYSFGALLLEIISGGKAIDVNREPACIAEWAVPLIKERKLNEICDRRIALPDCMVSTIKKILGLAANCVSLNEARRPSMAEVVNKMESCFIERVKLPNWISLLQSTVMLLRKRRKFPKRDRQKSCVASNLKGNAS